MQIERVGLPQIYISPNGAADDVQINAALKTLAPTGGKLILQAGNYSIDNAINMTGSNIYIEGEGGSADNAATFPNATYQGAIILASSKFPQGASQLVPNYMMIVGGNGVPNLQQLQGGGIRRITLGSTRGYAAGNIGGIALGFALKFTLEDISFGAFNNAISPTDYFLQGPAIAFDAALSCPTGAPNGGYFRILRCFFNKNGGLEAIRFKSSNVSDSVFRDCVWFGPFFNNGFVFVTNGSGIVFDNCLFSSVGANDASVINVNGNLSGLQVIGCTFQGQQNASAANSDAMVKLNITGDAFTDAVAGAVFTNNTFVITTAVTTPMKYLYNISATTANCPIHINGDVVVNQSGTNVTYLNNTSTSALISVQPPPIGTGVTLPAISGTLTAGSSPFTLTNTLGYPYWVNLVAINGMTGLTWRGVTVALTAGANYLLNPGDAMVFTWTTTAPTYKQVPASIQV